MVDIQNRIAEILKKYPLNDSKPSWLNNGYWNGKIYGYWRKFIYLNNEKRILTPHEYKELSQFITTQKEES